MNQIMALSADTPAYTLTTDMFKPLTNAVTSNVSVLITVGITVFAVVVSIGIIPKVIKKFI